MRKAPGLSGSRAMVFGGTSGIGLASARALAAAGAEVGVAGSTAGNLESALKSLPDGSRGFAVNASDAAAIAGAVVMVAANTFFTGAILDCDGGRHLGA